eukprot:557893-Prymnesium_polylepis.1
MLRLFALRDGSATVLRETWVDTKFPEFVLVGGILPVLPVASASPTPHVAGTATTAATASLAFRTEHSQRTERDVATCAHPPAAALRCGPRRPPAGWWKHASGYHSERWPEDVHHAPRVVGWIPVGGR